MVSQCFQVIGIIKRQALIKELAAAYHAECVACCKDLLQLHRKWEEVCILFFSKISICAAILLIFFCVCSHSITCLPIVPSIVRAMLGMHNVSHYIHTGALLAPKSFLAKCYTLVICHIVFLHEVVELRDECDCFHVTVEAHDI